MDDFLENDRKLLLIVGPSGSGKTSLVKDALNNKNYLCPSYNDYKLFQEYIENYIYTNEFFIQTDNSQINKIIFLDDVENLISQNKQAKQFITSILSQPIKIIMTCSTVEEKRVEHDYKQDYAVIRLERKNIDKSNLYKDRDIFEITLNVLNNYKYTLIDLDQALSYDPILISSMMFDNAIHYIPLAHMSNIFKTFCEMSEIEKFIFNNSESSTLNQYTFIQCCIIRLIQREVKSKILKNKHKIQFTQIPCRASQRYCALKKRVENMLMKQKCICKI